MASQKPGKNPGQRLLRGPLPWIIAVAAALWLAVSLLQGASAPNELTWSQFQSSVEDGQLQGQDLQVTTIGNRSQVIEGERTTGGSPSAFTVT